MNNVNNLNMSNQSTPKDLNDWLDQQTSSALEGIERFRASLGEPEAPELGNAKEEVNGSNVGAQNDPTATGAVPPAKSMFNTGREARPFTVGTVVGSLSDSSAPSPVKPSKPSTEEAKPRPPQPAPEPTPVPPVRLERSLTGKPGTAVIVEYFDRLNGVVAKEDIIANDPTGDLTLKSPDGQPVVNQYTEHVGRFEGGQPLMEISAPRAYQLATGLDVVSIRELKYFEVFKYEWKNMSARNRMQFIYGFARQALNSGTPSSIYAKTLNDPHWREKAEQQRNLDPGTSASNPYEDNEPMFF